MTDTRYSTLRTIDALALILVLVGAINWGLVGLFAFDLVAALFGEMTTLSRIVYTLVGAAGVYTIMSLPGMPRRWSLSTRTEAVREHEHTHV